MTYEQTLDSLETTLNRLACARLLDETAGPAIEPELRACAESLAGLAPAAARDLAAIFRTLAESGADDEGKLTAALTALERARSRATLPGHPPAVVTGSLWGAGGTAAGELAALEADPDRAHRFFAEARDHLGMVEAALLALEERPGDASPLDDVFRPFHAIEGHAGALGLVSLQEVAHAIENLITRARSGRQPMGPPEVDVMLRAVDVVTAMIADLGRRLKGHPAADLQAATQALLESVERLSAPPDPSP